MRRPRPWIPLDCGFWDDPRVARAVQAAGYEAGALYQMMLGWIMRHETAGTVPTLQPHGWLSYPQAALDALQAEGLVAVDNGQITVTAWDRWNEHPDEVRQRRRSDAQRKRVERLEKLSTAPKELRT